MNAIRERLYDFYNRNPKVAVAIVGLLCIGVFLGVLLLLQAFGPGSGNRKALQDRAAQSQMQSTPSSKPSSSPFDGITPSTMSQEQKRHPEADVLTAEQIAQNYNQTQSGLTPGAYETASDVAKRFVEIDVTGANPGPFQYYYDAAHDKPYGWVKDYQFVYSTSKQLGDGTVVAYVWFAGKNANTGVQIYQARYGVLLQIDQTGRVTVVPNPSFQRGGDGMGVEVVE